jgi:hypothetical protein
VSEEESEMCKRDRGGGRDKTVWKGKKRYRERGKKVQGKEEKGTGKGEKRYRERGEKVQGKGKKGTGKGQKRCRERKKRCREDHGNGKIKGRKRGAKEEKRCKGGKEVQRSKKYGLCLKKTKDHRSGSKETRRKATKGDHDM